MYYLDLSDREETQADFHADVRAKLQAAYARAKITEGATFRSLGQKLDVNRSVVFRHLSGGSNLTVKTIADLAWAMGKVPELTLRDKSRARRVTSTDSSIINNVSIFKSLSCNKGSNAVSLASGGDIVSQVNVAVA